MYEYLEETDFNDLPDDPEHSWIALEKTVYSRFLEHAEADQGDVIDEMRLHYMNLVLSLADQYGVKGVVISSESSTEKSFGKFRLAVQRAKARIWARSKPEYKFGRLRLSDTKRDQILELVSVIEIEIDGLDLSERRKKYLHRRLSDFRREIVDPQSRAGALLTSLAQISTVVAMTTTTLAQTPQAIETIQIIIGSEQLSIMAPEAALLIEEEKRLALPGQEKKLIAGPKEE